MYESFYGLKEKPFNILPDPDYLYMSTVHESAYTHLEYAIMENKGFVVITGEIGSGKTTMINYLISKVQQVVQVGLINQTYISPTQFIKMVCQDYELDVKGMDKAEMVDLLHEFLLTQFAMNERVILIIDEAQNLTPETLEELRMLSNLEAEKHHLIQMILVGQPELKFKLQKQSLTQFTQRVTVHCHLEGLSDKEVEKYILYRLKVAGADHSDIFTTEAIAAIYQYSHGIPRIINVISDAALVYGFADEKKTIDKHIIESVIAERKSGGLFAENEQLNEDAVAAMGPIDAVELGTQIPGYHEIERRVRLLENRFDTIEQQLSVLARKRDERDNVVIELFKLLKDSMEKRLDTLLMVKNDKT